MRTMLLSTLGLAVAGMLAFPAISGAQTASRDSVTGTASIEIDIGGGTFRPVSFDFNAFSGPSGENPTGTVVISTTGTEQVTCLAINGNRAAIGLHGPFGPETADFYVVVVDGGTTGRDAINSAPLFSSGPATACATTTGGGTPTPIATGDVVVHDATPLPTSKDQCKHGGWRQFGFKNQGQCVAFVNHQARQACLAERATIGSPAFRAKYGKGRQHRIPLQRCIRRTAQG